MLDYKSYIHSLLGLVLLWATPVIAQDFTDLWCELAEASGNKCHVFSQNWQDDPVQVAIMDDTMETALNKIKPIVNRTLTLSVAGNGKVVSSPTGINCGSQCSGYFVEGSSVTFSAIPDTGYQLSRWQGACSGTENTATFVVSSDANCSATFIVTPVTVTPVQPPPVVTPSPITTPATGDSTTTPATGDSTTTPATGDSITTPATGDSITTPATGNSTTTPATGDSTTTPATGDSITTPATGDSTTTPATGDSTTTPATGDSTTTPVTGNSTTETPSTPETSVTPTTVCRPETPLQAVQSHVELTVGEEHVVKISGGQQRSVLLSDSKLVTLKEFEGVGGSEFGIKLLGNQVGQTQLKVTDCTGNAVTVSLTVNPQPLKRCEAHAPLVAQQPEVIFMLGDTAKTIQFTGGLDDTKTQRGISQFPDAEIAQVTDINTPAGSDLTVSLQPVGVGETYLKVQDCSGETSVRILVTAPNAQVVNRWGKFDKSKSYFKPTLKLETDGSSVETYVRVEADHQGETLEILYVLETLQDGQPVFQTWNSQKTWQPWDGRDISKLAVAETFSKALESLTTHPVILPKNATVSKLYVGYRVPSEQLIVFYGTVWDSSGL